MKKLATIAIGVFVSWTSFSQDRLDSIFVAGSAPLVDVIRDVEEKHKVQFFFLEKWLLPYHVPATPAGENLRTVLEQTLAESAITFRAINRYQVIFYKNAQWEEQRQNLLSRVRQYSMVVDKVILGESQAPQPMHPYRVTGRVLTDEKKPVAGASLEWNKNSLVTDSLGAFRLTLSPGSHVLMISHVNHHPKLLEIEVYRDSPLTVELEDKPVLLQEVVIQDQPLTQRPVGQTTIRVSELTRLPVFLGEQDIVRQVQAQPGVTTVGEISSGFHARGGSVDQNLVLLDGVPIYNTSHALGFFGAFQAQAINSASFYKGFIPAPLGGRLSSVLNVTSREGDYENWTGTVGAGIISSFASINGPLKEGRSSLQLAARKTYSNWMLDALKSNYVNLSQGYVDFYDGNVKLTQKLRKNQKLTLSAYASNDKFRVFNDTVMQWQNRAGSLRYDFSRGRWQASALAGASEYNFTLTDTELIEAYKLSYHLLNPVLKLDAVREGAHRFSMGVQSNLFHLAPGEIIAGEFSRVSSAKMSREKAIEPAFYFSDEFEWKRLNVEAGIRYAAYAILGPETVYLYQEGQPKSVQTVVDSTRYAVNKIGKFFNGLEPRIAVSYRLSPGSTTKASYSRSYQFIHLVTNTTVPTPVDVWQLSDVYFKPQVGDQFSLGYFQKLEDQPFEFSLEGFAREMKNTLDFKDGGSLLLNNNLETALLAGRARAYGAELSLSKTSGRLMGVVNYTFSRSERKVNGAFEEETINRGNWYPANFDQPHVVNMSWRYGISRRHFFSGNFVYHTGRPFSTPTAFFTIDGVPVTDFSERNNARLGDYHRLDIAFIIEGNHKKKKLGDGTIIFSFFNVYSRKNPYSVFFRTDELGRLKPYQLSVVGSIIPSLTYQIKL